jgi:dihydrofolate reductase
MRTLNAFTFLTLNGFYKGPNEDITWHRHGGEEAEFSEEGLMHGSILLFGRKTYEMMVAFWPTPMAKESFPNVADGMNKAEKIVFSNTLKKADWNNTRIIGGDIVREVRKLKQSGTKDMTILGSGSIVTQLAGHGLIDAYQIMIDPVALGAGTPIFNGLQNKLDLHLTDVRRFKSGIVVLSYVLL